SCAYCSCPATATTPRGFRMKWVCRRGFWRNPSPQVSSRRASPSSWASARSAARRRRTGRFPVDRRRRLGKTKAAMRLERSNVGKRLAPLLILVSPAATGGCKKQEAEATPAPAAASAVPAAAASGAAPLSSLVVDHGELDTKAPDEAPTLAATIIAATVYKLPNVDSRRLGYLRLGGIVKRDKKPVSGKGCKGEWYRVYPMGYMCTDEVTIDVDDPLVRAASRRPQLDKPLPYRYGFVRATAPQYLRIPTKAEQLKSEFKLEEHLEWFRQHEAEVQRVEIGANDVPLDPRGIARPGLK